MDRTRATLFEIMHEEGLSSAKALERAKTQVLATFPRGFAALSEGQEKSFTDAIARFQWDCLQRWKDASRTLKTFLTKNANWLSSELVVPDEIQSCLTDVVDDPMEGTSKSAGRPPVPFSKCTSHTRRVKTADIRALPHGGDELAYAAQMKLREEGRHDAANVVKKVIAEGGPDPRKVRDSYRRPPQMQPKAYDGDEALALLLNANLTKQAYMDLREGAQEHGIDLYPSNHVLLDAKRKCYPPNFSISETSGEVPIQSLLDHTASRLCEVQAEVIESVHPVPTSATLHCKYGFDGASGQQHYKQVFSGSLQDEASLFIACLVPLQLKTQDGQVLWENNRPGSTIFCRPIRFCFEKKTTASTNALFSNLNDQIGLLSPTTVTLKDGATVVVTHQLSMTMIDCKVSNTVAGVSSMVACTFCGAKPLEMNDIQTVICRPISKPNMESGISTLHCWMRSMEMFLKIAYRRDFKEWQARGAELKQKVEQRKKEAQDAFRARLSLLIDIPLPTGGTTNDGNMARRFFAAYEESAAILELDATLIYRFWTLLRALSSGFHIDERKFQEYAFQTAELYVDLYPWFRMPVSVHKMLIHGAAVASGMELPIGIMSEEAQESRNKDFRSIRAHHARQTTRRDTNEDMLLRLLTSSDPVISSHRARRKFSQRGSLSEDVVALLRPPEVK